jgi:hypothetical protein
MKRPDMSPPIPARLNTFATNTAKSASIILSPYLPVSLDVSWIAR